MTPTQFQAWLNDHGASIAVDGKCGPATRAAILQVFANKEAPAANDADYLAFASNLGCTVKQIKAVVKVESGGSGFLPSGLPKILFERHYFHRLTEGRYSPASYSNSKSGGYSEDSWEKLCHAACKDVDAAFSSASWGRAQVMGAHWSKLGYPSPVSMAWVSRQSEGDQIDMMVRYIKAFNLTGAVRRLSADPDDNREFASGYNGPSYTKFNYHVKLAEAMA